MPTADAVLWSELLRRTLSAYDEALVRQVAARLVKPRSQWPVEELIDRCAAAVENPAVLDRRRADLEPDARRLLALIGHSRQPTWDLGNLVEMTLALGAPDGLAPVFALMQAGLLFPRLPESGAVRIKTFEQWLAFPTATGLAVFTTPLIASRAVGEDLELPDLSSKDEGGRTKDKGKQGDAAHSSFLLPPSSFQEADGLEWLLRMAVLWQQTATAPLRRTQQGDFFKRDLDRLSQDPLLNGPPPDRLTDVPDMGFLTAVLAERVGVLREVEGDVCVGSLPGEWDTGLAPSLEAIWSQLPRLRAWNPIDGWRGGETPAGNPFPSAYLLAFLLLARAPADAWIDPEAVEKWLNAHHPYWKDEFLRPSRREPWVQTFLLGAAYPLRLVQASPLTLPSPPSDGGEGRVSGDAWRVRLSPTGRWLLGLGEAPSLESPYSQTLLVQPNLEIIAYRQGLSSALIAKLTRFATWKSLSTACTLQLEPDAVYRALEAGESYDSIRQALEQHSSKALPNAVLDLLRTWSNKRERITIYPAATLLEFATPEDLQEALARGVPAVRISDRMAVAASEDAMEFRHFRLSGTRDYALPPERCVSVEPDGVTLTVDLARSDLLLETELPRFAERLDGSASSGTRQYVLTPASLEAARSVGMTLATLELWFQQRTGAPLPPAARLLMTGGETPPARFQRHLVLHVADEETADGLMQWPQTRELIAARLGPTALAVEEEQAAELRRRLKEAGVEAVE
ncbi:MAG TPA: helicase-associated domain-containing protein [Gemmataceae bacterium]|nr:helicase-associated domain-containing protein [Gemmataceae bacterium]